MSGLERALITGGGGQLAGDLERALAGRCAVESRSRSELDITDGERLREAIAAAEPDVLFNCAAFHNVDVCEGEEERALAVNAIAVKRMAAACAERGTRLVHVSTNYVFDGTADAPYPEDATPSPRSVYAISKLAGEHAALAYGRGALVVRTGGLYGRFGSVSKGGSFVTRMLARAREGEQLKVVDDQHLSPTPTADLAAAMVEAVAAGAEGVLHLTASGECSWFELTRAIVELAGIEADVRPVATTRPPGGARRPRNAVLARPRADALGLTPLAGWRQGLERFLAEAGELAGAAPARAIGAAVPDG